MFVSTWPLSHAFVLYVHYSRKAAAGRAPRPPLRLTVGGRFESATLAVAKGDDNNDDAVVDGAANNMPDLCRPNI